MSVVKKVSKTNSRVGKSTVSPKALKKIKEKKKKGRGMIGDDGGDLFYG